MLSIHARFGNRLISIRHLCTITEKKLVDTTETTIPHVPVLLEESLTYLKPRNGETILDMTFGGGGHSRRILEKSPKVKLLCLDRDPKAFFYAEELSKEYPCRVFPMLGKFSDLPKLLKSKNIMQNSIDGILFDFGCSSMQFDEGIRGFSVSKNGPLDMRMGGNMEPGIAFFFIETNNA